jgi:hypothetical protein
MRKLTSSKNAKISAALAFVRSCAASFSHKLPILLLQPTFPTFLKLVFRSPVPNKLIKKGRISLAVGFYGSPWGEEGRTSASRARSVPFAFGGGYSTVCARTAARGCKSARQRASPLPLPLPPTAPAPGSPRCRRSRASVTPSTRGKTGHATPARTGLAHAPHGPRPTPPAARGPGVATRTSSPSSRFECIVAMSSFLCPHPVRQEAVIRPSSTPRSATQLN